MSTIATAKSGAKQKEDSDDIVVTGELCVFKDIYVRLVGTKEKPEIWIIDGQGIAPAKCQYSVDGFRNKHDRNTLCNGR